MTTRPLWVQTWTKLVDDAVFPGVRAKAVRKIAGCDWCACSRRESNRPASQSVRRPAHNSRCQITQKRLGFPTDRMFAQCGSDSSTALGRRVNATCANCGRLQGAKVLRKAGQAS